MKRKLQEYETIYGKKALINLPIRDVQLLGWVKGDSLVIETDIVNKTMKICRIQDISIGNYNRHPPSLLMETKKHKKGVSSLD